MLLDKLQFLGELFPFSLLSTKSNKRPVNTLHTQEIRPPDIMYTLLLLHLMGESPRRIAHLHLSSLTHKHIFQSILVLTRHTVHLKHYSFIHFSYGTNPG